MVSRKACRFSLFFTELSHFSKETKDVPQPI
uniref:Uncharacterized protein n=1 Tax=Rhizophora mucronata TaxID=61149 RepID=A0A2P2QUN1_RHIMU